MQEVRNREKNAENCVRSFHLSLSAWLVRADLPGESGYCAVRIKYKQMICDRVAYRIFFMGGGGGGHTH